MVVEISDKTFDSEVLKSNIPVLVDMWATWCGPCRMIGPIIEKLAPKYDGKVKFCKLNIDDNKQTPAKFRVMSIPTLILFKDGKAVETVVGAVPEQVLKQKIDAHL